jgi:pimeloyl-ACP methyl ester carboxylesterase
MSAYDPKRTLANPRPGGPESLIQIKFAVSPSKLSSIALREFATRRNVMPTKLSSADRRTVLAASGAVAASSLIPIQARAAAASDVIEPGTDTSLTRACLMSVMPRSGRRTAPRYSYSTAGPTTSMTTSKLHQSSPPRGPHLRGHGTTRFLDTATPRSGQQAAIGVDVIALMDALKIPTAVLAGYDWGGRAACVVAALWPERCTGLVSVNDYLIQDIAHAGTPLPVKLEWGIWTQFYFATERGRAGLAANRNDIARLLWTNESPTWHFDEATFQRSAASFDNPDYVDVVIHSYRHRLGLAPGYPQYADVEAKLAAQPIITVSTVTLDGEANGIIPASDGRSSAAKFSGRRIHHRVPNAGHALPQQRRRCSPTQ